MQNLRVVPVDRTFAIMSPDGQVLGVHPDRQRAVSAAFEVLRGSGGSVTVLRPDGTQEVPMSVAAPAPGALISPDDMKALERLAKAADQMLGREAAGGSPLTKGLDGIEVDKLLPKGVAETGKVRLVNTYVSAAAAWAALIGLVLGSGTVGSVVSAAGSAARGSATVGSYETVVLAFIATSAVCISVLVAVYFVKAGGTLSYGALGVWVLFCIGLCAILPEFGLAAPSPEFVAKYAATGGNPVMQAVGVITAYIAFYGPVQVLIGAGVGFFSGLLAHRIKEAG